MSKTAIVLGGTNPHIELIKQLKNRNYSTVLIDYLEDSPAIPYADFHEKASTLDQQSVLKLAEQYRADLVVSACVDQANVTASYVSEKLNLPSLYSYETALVASSKHLMKERFVSFGIPTAQYMYLKSANDCEKADLVYPCVIKPSDSSGSKGVTVVNSIEEAIMAYHEACEISRTNQVIMEEFVNGQEIQVDCFAVESKAYLLMINKKIKLGIGSELTSTQSSGSVAPIQVNGTVLNSLKIVAQAIVDAFELRTTPFFFQAIVRGDRINVIEFAPRIGGGLSYRVIPSVTQFNTLHAVIDSLHNIVPQVKVTYDGMMYSTNNVYTNACGFGRIEGAAKLLNSESIHEFYIYKTVGAKVGSKHSSNNRVAGFIIRAQNEMDMIEKTRMAYNSISVYDDRGKIIPHYIPQLELGFSAVE